MNVRSRLSLVPLALAAAVALVGCGQQGGESTSAAPVPAAPVSAAPAASAPTIAAPAAKPPAGKSAAAKPPATAAVGPARTAAGATRVTFALLRPNGPDGELLVATYDTVDYRRASCEAASAKGVTDEQALYEACWSNVNSRLRTALFLDQDQAITAYYPPNNEPSNYVGEVGYAADELQILLVEGGGHRSYDVAVWRIVESGGKVVALTELPGGPLSAAEAAEAARA